MPKEYRHVPKANPYSHEGQVARADQVRKNNKGNLAKIAVIGIVAAASLLKVGVAYYGYKQNKNNQNVNGLADCISRGDCVVLKTLNSKDYFVVAPQSENADSLAFFYIDIDREIVTEHKDAKEFFAEWARLSVSCQEVGYHIQNNKSETIASARTQYLTLADERDFQVMVVSDATDRAVWTMAQGLEILSAWVAAQSEFNAANPLMQRPPLSGVEIDQAAQEETIRRNVEKLRELQQLPHPRGR